MCRSFSALGFNVLLVFLFLTISRIFDVKFGRLHITGISFALLAVMLILSRGFMVALHTKIGKALLGFTICMGAAVPFSIWRGGSKDIFMAWATFSFVAFLAMAGMVGIVPAMAQGAQDLVVGACSCSL